MFHLHFSAMSVLTDILRRHSYMLHSTASGTSFSQRCCPLSALTGVKDISLRQNFEDFLKSVPTWKNHLLVPQPIHGSRISAMSTADKLQARHVEFPRPKLPECHDRVIPLRSRQKDG